MITSKPLFAFLSVYAILSWSIFILNENTGIQFFCFGIGLLVDAKLCVRLGVSLWLSIFSHEIKQSHMKKLDVGYIPSCDL